MRSAASPPYRSWPRYRPDTVELGGLGWRNFAVTMVALFGVAALLCIPPVAKTFGLAPVQTLSIAIVYAALMAMNDAVLYPAAQRSTRAFHAQLAIVPIYNLVCLSSLVVLPNQPESPLWMLVFLYACTTGSWQEIDPSYAYLALHTAFPLLTIPIFLARGADPGWSWAGPLLTATLSGAAYHMLSLNSFNWRKVRAEQAEAIARLRERHAELERERIARELHDSLGSALGLSALYADLIERKAHDPVALVGISSELRESARQGIGDLRGILEALDPDSEDLASLGKSLEHIGRRVAQVASVDVHVVVTGNAGARVEAPKRLALLRVFQESVNNAVRHGAARSIEARLDAASRALSLAITDDGVGFDPEHQPAGRGRTGMRARATELGGDLTVHSTPGGGTVVRLELPVTWEAAS